MAGLLKLGLPLNEETARLPSLLAAILTALLVLHLGRRLFSPRVALLRGCFTATALGTWKWGRNARPEMMLAMLWTAAMVCFHHALHGSGKGGTGG